MSLVLPAIPSPTVPLMDPSNPNIWNRIWYDYMRALDQGTRDALAGGSSGTPGGVATSGQFNNGFGGFGGDASFTYSGNGRLNIGASGHTAALKLIETAGNAVTVSPQAATAAWTLTLPPDPGSSSGQLLQTDGAGVTSWVSPPAHGVVLTGNVDLTPFNIAYAAAPNAGSVFSQSYTITGILVGDVIAWSARGGWAAWFVLQVYSTGVDNLTVRAFNPLPTARTLSGLTTMDYAVIR